MPSDPRGLVSGRAVSLFGNLGPPMAGRIPTWGMSGPWPRPPATTRCPTPITTQSGVGSHTSNLTKAGDPLLREMLFTAADAARKTDPQLAAKYQRLMAGDRHHDSAICHTATTLVTRIAACMRSQQPYQLRDVDGTPITPEQGRDIVKQRYQTSKKRRDNIRHERMRLRRTQEAGQESPSAPTPQPAHNHPTSPLAA